MKPVYRFQDTSLSFEERAKDLVSHLTREEKIGMLTSYLDDVPRLGIQKTHFGVEIARGLVQRDSKRETTILPQPWGMAAMFDDALMEKLGDMAGDEVRISSQTEEKPSSLVLFGPTVDMERDPRWGRNEEAYGEDPCLTGKMTVAYTKGLAGKDPKYRKSAPLLKHFYANNYENGRQTTNANITPRLKYEYYLRAFEPAIREGGAVGLMTAYNRINGVEGLNNPDVSEICKKKWGMTFAVSDGGDFGQNVSAHRTYEDHAKSIAGVLGAGADMMLDSRDMVDPAVREALEKGYLSEENLDKALIAMFTVRFLLGDFDPEENPYAHMDPSRLACSEHKKLAVRAAEESMILLENRGLLPLKDDGKCKVAVLGPLSDKNYTCWYCGYAPHQISVVNGLREMLGEDRVLFDEGFDYVILKSRRTGKYVRLGENGELIADAAAEKAEVFERSDWDFGSWTLRSLRTRKYVTEGGGFVKASEENKENGRPSVSLNPGMNCVSDEAFGWFVMELIKAQEENGVLYLTSWQDRDMIADETGRIVSAFVPGNGREKEFEAEVLSFGRDRAAELAGEADYAIVCAGNHPLINAREEYDRPDIRLPLAQSALLNAACGANENTLLYLITGYPFAIVEERKKAKAVLCSTHLGPSLGRVAADTIFGKNNPAGRTPTTWYRSVKDLPAMDDYDIMKNRTTYLYFNGEPLYPFGYGLSYTQFAYSNAKAGKKVYGEDEEITASVTVENVGSYDGDEVVQLYVVPPKSVYTRPRKMLKAFRRVFVQKSRSVCVDLAFKVSDLAFWCTDTDSFVVEEGDYVLQIGASSEDIRCEAAVHVNGTVITGRDAQKKRSAIDADDYRGVQFLTDRKDGMAYLEAGDFRSFAVYKGLDLKGCDAFEALISSPAGHVDLILADNHTGEIIGTCSTVGTGSLIHFSPVSCEIRPRNGLLDLRICFTKQTSLKSFRFYYNLL
ncbi:MAG: glycoside hydrolase family 3 C-terminal domain-containing protein [Syntrophales bacterium]|nr:glycoside hydrolase family 3 C-terminal domain-containing protein [Syntrophales bacterium]